MSIVMKAFNATDAKDIDAIAAILHDDFVYFNDYEMHSREDYLVALAEFWKDKGSFEEGRRVLCDTRDCFAMERHDVFEGKEVNVTWMALLKDNKMWRAMIHRVER